MRRYFFVSLALTGLLPLVSHSQNFVMRESNLDPKKNGFYFEIARKCELFLQNKEAVGSLPFSNNATVTNTTLHYLSEQFMNRMSDMKDSKDYGMALDRPFQNDKEKIIKYTYGVLPPDKAQTMKYTQLIVKFDQASSSPKIVDVQIKSQADLGFFNLSGPEVARLRKKPEPVQPVAHTSKPSVQEKKPVAQTSKPSAQPKKTAVQTSKPATQQTKPASQVSKAAVQQKKPGTRTTKPATQQKKAVPAAQKKQ